MLYWYAQKAFQGMKSSIKAKPVPHENQRSTAAAVSAVAASAATAMP